MRQEKENPVSHRNPKETYQATKLLRNEFLRRHQINEAVISKSYKILRNVVQYFFKFKCYLLLNILEMIIPKKSENKWKNIKSLFRDNGPLSIFNEKTFKRRKNLSYLSLLFFVQFVIKKIFRLFNTAYEVFIGKSYFLNFSRSRNFPSTSFVFKIKCTPHQLCCFLFNERSSFMMHSVMKRVLLLPFILLTAISAKVVLFKVHLPLCLGSIVGMIVKGLLSGKMHITLSKFSNAGADWIIKTCCFLLLISIVSPVAQAKDKDKLKMVTLDGDVIFGGMFPMHERGGESPCGTIKEEKGIQRMEAMLYALGKINEDPKLLPNITLGTLILDTCSSDTYALEQSMEFFRASLSQDVSAFKCEGGKEPLYDPPKPVAGVIGAAGSSVSVMIANILRLFKIPQISYASTSTELSDKTRFDYFSRVVPPDNFQAQAMVEIVKELGWKYVSTLASEGGYGEKGIASFMKLAEGAGICVAVSERIKRLMSKPEEFDEIIERLSTKPQARVVIMFVDEDNTRRLLAAATKANKTGWFLWVGSDSWGAKIHPVRDQEEVARGAITILPQRRSLSGFDDYFRSLRPKMRRIPCSKPHPNPKLFRNCRNIWFKEFWTHHFNCTFREHLPATSGRRKCTGEEEIKTEQEGLVPFVVDAVYALAHAYHNLVMDVCGEMVLCDEVSPTPSGEILLQYIRNVSFVGRQGREVKFNRDGDAPGSYFIFQYQEKGPNTFDYVLIGKWTESLQINMSQLTWTSVQLQNESNRHPISICSTPCPAGHIRNFQDACCWSCVPCPDDCIVYNDTCKPCKLGWAPTKDFISCYKLTPEHITWDSVWAIVPVVFSSIGLLFTLLTTITFIRYNKTPIIMASGRELCYVLLIGIALCYLMTFVVLSPPSTPMCASFRIGVGLGLCICYSAIFTKTNRISRIFNRGVKSIKRPSYTSPKSQIVICTGLVGVQLVGVVAWLLVEVPTTTEVYPYRLVAVLTCGISNISLMLSLGYNMILIILCTIYAFKTRKIPENFNEAKYIGFTMYSTCIVWLAFVPIYFGTNNDYKIQLASLCMCVSISASVALGCLFTPKVYIVIFQPYKNVRQGSGQVKGSSHSKNYGTSMRFTPRSQTAQSVLSTNHSSCPAPPPSTISQHVNGETLNVKAPQNNPPNAPNPLLEKSSIT